MCRLFNLSILLLRLGGVYYIYINTNIVIRETFGQNLCTLFNNMKLIFGSAKSVTFNVYIQRKIELYKMKYAIL